MRNKFREESNMNLDRPPWKMPIVIGLSSADAVTGIATEYFIRAAEDGKAHGFDIEVIDQSLVTTDDFKDQVAIIEDYIERKVDVIAISVGDIELIKPAVIKANRNGIPVFIMNMLEPIAGIDVASYIGFNNTIAGAISAYALVDYFGGPGVLGKGEIVEVKPETSLDLAWWRELYKDVDPSAIDVKARVAIIEGIAGNFSSNARLNGFHSVVDQYPYIEIVGTLPADWNHEKGIKAAEDFLITNPPGTLDAIWAASNVMGLGAMVAVKSAGRQDEVKVFSNDVTSESVNRIVEGSIEAETYHGFREWGWYGTEFAVKIVCGTDIPQFFDIRPRTVYRGNVSFFYPEPPLKPIDWEDIKAKCK